MARVTVPFIHNRIAAAEQDFELAKEEKREALTDFKPTCRECVRRVRAAHARLELARERWLEVKG